MSNKTLQDDLDELGKAFKKLGDAMLAEWTSFAIVVLMVWAFVIGACAEHFFPELISILWK